MGSWNFFDRPQHRAWLDWLPEWAVKKQDERFLEALLHCKGGDGPFLDRQIQRTLLIERWKRAIAPYLYIFKLVWEVARGRYWTAAKKVHGSTNPPPGGNVTAGAGYTSSTATTIGGPGISTAPKATFEDAGIRAGEVVAYRCWQLRSGLLYSMYREDFCWKPGEIVEGDADSGGGIHGFKDPLAAGAYGYHAQATYSVVSGTVELWGTVYEHQHGYRASKAAIASIDDSPNYDAKSLRKLYGLTRKGRSKNKGLVPRKRG